MNELLLLAWGILLVFGGYCLRHAMTTCLRHAEKRGIQ